MAADMQSTLVGHHQESFGLRSHYAISSAIGRTVEEKNSEPIQPPSRNSIALSIAPRPNVPNMPLFPPLM